MLRVDLCQDAAQLKLYILFQVRRLNTIVLTHQAYLRTLRKGRSGEER